MNIYPIPPTLWNFFSPDEFIMFTTNRPDEKLTSPLLPTDPGYEILRFFMVRKKAKDEEEPLEPLTDDPLPYEENADSVFEKYFYLDKKSKPSESNCKSDSKKTSPNK